MSAPADRLAALHRFLDRRLERGHVRFAGRAALVCALIGLVVQFATSDRGRTVFADTPLGADFSGFYNAGSIRRLPEAERERLYDVEFQTEHYRELLPNLPPSFINPFVHPPLVAVLFEPLALLPYEVAFAVWLVITAALYVGGFLLLWRDLPDLPATDRGDALLVALAFEPFLMECWLGGQFAAVAFFFFAAATHFELAGRRFRSGLELGVLLYKPTMLVLFLPLLLVARRWKTLAGVAVTGLVMLGLSVLFVGPKVCEDYVHLLLNFTGTTVGGGLVLKEWKWVDANFFGRLLLGGPSLEQKVLFVLLVLPPLVFLVRAWWRLDRRDADQRCLLWAAVVTWTMIVNVYVAIYDTLPVVLGLLLTMSVLCRGRSGLPPGLRDLLVLLFVSAWVAQPLARLTHVQLFTLVLMALGTYQLVQAEKIERASDLPKPEAGPSE